MPTETEVEPTETETGAGEQETAPNPAAELQAKLDALAAQNQKLNDDMRQVVAYAQYMEKAAGVGGAPGGRPAPEPEPLDVDEDTKKLLAQRDQQWAQSLGTVQDKLDQLTFQNTLLASGLGADPELLKEVDVLTQNMRRAGIPSFDETGRPVAYQRSAALKQVLGDRALRGAITQAPTRTIETLRTQLYPERPGAGPVAAKQPVFDEESWNKLPLEERLKRQAADLDKNGF